MASLKSPAVILKPGREKSMLRRHPWVFEGGIARVLGEPTSGQTIGLYSSRDEFLGYGAFSEQSQIRVRMWGFDDRPIDEAWFAGRIKRAIGLREALLKDPAQTACRLISAESDGLPGLVVDRYNEVLVCQFLSAGAEAWRTTIVAALERAFPGYSIYERSDVDVRNKEGLPSQSGLLSGEMPPSDLVIQEGPVKIEVDVMRGHKTGFYLDQRENRAIVAGLSVGKSMLNCFSYTGGFSLAALAAGASDVVNVESSALAIEASERNHRLNNFGEDQVMHVEGDVFKVLRRFREEGRIFDVIVLDPPKFVDSQALLDRAARGYKDINRLAFSLLRSGGYLATFSCSGLMPVDLFQKIVADAALDVPCEGQIIQRLGQAADHPTQLPFPEGFYLKGFICRVL
jgi:23S rRNA (cytosine1962-C5)-methyltransferase